MALFENIIQLGTTGTNYSQRIEWLEGFSRPLFGLIPFTFGGGESELWSIYLKGIKNGTNPNHTEFWGYTDRGQMFVEMASIGLALALCPEKIWTPLSDAEKQNLQTWLNHINTGDCGHNNWLFFRVFVNVGLKKSGAIYDEIKLYEALEELDTHYLSDGWYADGKTDQRDYYIPFAMHFYGLLYSVLMEQEDPERAKIYKERAVLFAKDFIQWFSHNGAALPFGRSLAYRFAMGAFWGGLAYANIEAVPWGVIKGLMLRHLRWWMQQEIFNQDGTLMIGFTYPNLKMAEFYNSAGAVYWAFKGLFPLALPDDHPFWTVDEEKLPTDLPAVSLQPHPYMLICREKDRDHVFALAGGQHAKWEPTFDAAKYGKFVYSTVFGFSVPAGEYGLTQGAFDSMLALCEQDELYRGRKICEKIEVANQYHYSLWKPWHDVTIQTWLIPVMPWHIRVHQIVSGRKLIGAEGGFSINVMDDHGDFSYQNEFKKTTVSTVTPIGLSGIVNLFGSRTPEMVMVAPNTNVLFPRTAIPTLKGEIQKGETLLISAVLGQPIAVGKEFAWIECPEIFLKDGVLEIIYQKQSMFIHLTNHKP